MNTDKAVQAIEDFLESEGIPLSQFKIIVLKSNGDSSVEVSRKDNKPITQMYQLSEIINSYSINWIIEVRDKIPVIIIN
jgi:hypothetical protein